LLLSPRNLHLNEIFFSEVCYRQRDMNTASYTVYFQVEKLTIIFVLSQ